MTERIAPRFRKTKSDKWAVMAPVEDLETALGEGGVIEVQKRSGDWSKFRVTSLGKPFDVDGVQMCYGYGPDDTDGGDRVSKPSSSDDHGSQDRRPVDGGQPGSTSAGRRAYRSASSHQAPPTDSSEPLPEYQGGPEDEWDGYGYDSPVTRRSRRSGD